MENTPLVITFLIAYLLGAGSVLGLLVCLTPLGERKGGRDDINL